MAVLLAVFFVVSLTASMASACKQQEPCLSDKEQTCKQQEPCLLDAEQTCEQQELCLSDTEQICEQQEPICQEQTVTDQTPSVSIDTSKPSVNPSSILGPNQGPSREEPEHDSIPQSNTLFGTST